MSRNILLAIVLVLVIAAIGILQSQQARPTETGAESAALVPVTTEPVTPNQATSTAPASPTPKPTAVAPATRAPSPAATYLTPKQKAAAYEPGHELAGITGYLNLPAGQNSITLQSLVGKKIVLVDFWTYSCINCQRTLPYLNAWYDKYRDAGLEIVGVETPEFDFEKVTDNVKAAIAKFGIKYPVVQDNNYGTWVAYGNRYWPRKYLIDIDGFVVYDHIGEGSYAETEAMIQKLLAERSSRLGLTTAVPTGTVNPAAPKPMSGTSPETYFGASRNEYLANGTPGKTGSQHFSNNLTTDQMSANRLYLAGDWNITPEYAVTQNVVPGPSAASPTGIAYKFTAQNVYFVANAASPIKVGVRVDGSPLTAANAGTDVSIDPNDSDVTTITVDGARLYHILKNIPAGTHVLELSPQSSGLEAFTFTFG